MTAVEAGIEIRTIKAQPLSREAFEPFGLVVAAEGERKPIDIYGKVINVFSGGLIDSDVPVEFLISRSSVREFRVRFLERHLKLAQSFFPLLGGDFISVVARPDAELDESGIPRLEGIKAFMVPGDRGITLHRGTWHEPPFPLADNQLRLTTSHSDLTAGLESNLNDRGEIDKLDVDKRDITQRSGYVLRIDLP
jgi:ureidoglycolate lyase